MATEKEETSELTVRVTKRDAARLKLVAERIFGITGSMLARILIHHGLESMEDVFSSLGRSGAQALRQYDLENPRT